jgi:four helix bundle protein
MLDIYPVSQAMAKDAMAVVRSIGEHDRELARQLSRAATSVPLSLSEGSYSHGGNRASRYHTAMGSAAEVRAILELAENVGWIPRDPVRHARLNRIVGTLVNVLKLKR